MVKKLSVILLVLTMLVLATSFSLAYDLEGLPSITMTLAHTEAPLKTNFIHSAALEFKSFVEEKSDGQIKVDIAPAGELGGSTELIEQGMMGAIEAFYAIAEGHLAPFFPSIQAVTVPYLFYSVEHALEVLEGWYGDLLFGRMEDELGLVVMGVGDNGGFRCFTNTVRPIRTPADMEGLKIRTMEIPAHMEMVRALGADPTPVPWLELYSALETGVVDGQENSVPTIDLGKLQEVQKYLILDNHVFTFHPFSVNASWYYSLPTAYQEIIREGGYRATKAAQRQSTVQRDLLVSVFEEEYGVEVYSPTFEELELFRDATQERVLNFLLDEVDRDLLQDLFKATKEAAEDLGYPPLELPSI